MNNAKRAFRPKPLPIGRALTIALFVVTALAPQLEAQDERKLPSDLVYLRDVDPTIFQDIRYATHNNFTGRPVDGYTAQECLLIPSAAVALGKVQRDLKSQGLALKVYDCYRPQRAVRAFAAWARNGSDTELSKRFFPRVKKSQLLSLGYIAERSGHSRGVAVDAAIVQLPPVASGGGGEECASQREKRSADTTLDFGTGFDCFDAQSHTYAKMLSPSQVAARATLIQAMGKHGFRNYEREWWHFTFGNAAAGKTFDVPITAHPGGVPGLSRE